MDGLDTNTKLLPSSAKMQGVHATIEKVKRYSLVTKFYPPSSQFNSKCQPLMLAKYTLSTVTAHHKLEKNIWITKVNLKQGNTVLLSSEARARGYLTSTNWVIWSILQLINLAVIAFTTHNSTSSSLICKKKLHQYKYKRHNGRMLSRTINLANAER